MNHQDVTGYVLREEDGGYRLSGGLIGDKGVYLSHAKYARNVLHGLHASLYEDNVVLEAEPSGFRGWLERELRSERRDPGTPEGLELYLSRE